MLPSLRDARSASEYPKSLSSWLELDYFRRRGPMRRVRGLIGWVCLLSCAAVVTVCAVLPRSRQVYQAAPVSPAHVIFNDDCETCHDVRFATASRLLHGDDSIHSVTDAACLRCHAGEVHHASQIGASSCAGCHREHRGSTSLARVEDGDCTSCHADLSEHTKRGSSEKSGPRYRDIEAFLGGSKPHPAFALTEHPEDRGTIRFNHKAHLNPNGVLVTGTLERRTLACIDCHEPDQDRRYMRPIRFEAHCQDCHPLSVQVFGPLKDRRALDEAQRFRSQPAPHPKAQEGAELVRAVLRDRYLGFAREVPSVYEERVAVEPQTPLPGRRNRESSTSIRFASEWAERQLEQAERLLFEGAGGCRYCHQEARGANTVARTLPRYAPSAITLRWLPHSVFSHDSHRSLRCGECHVGAAESQRTSDVLMPGIESCRTCHTGKDRGARSDCVECHSYHPASRPRDLSRELSIEEFLRPPVVIPRHGGRSTSR